MILGLMMVRYQLAIWVGSFLFGQIFALSFNFFIYLSHDLWASVLQMLFLFFSICSHRFYRYKIFSGAIFILGFSWGFVHESKIPAAGRKQAVVVSAEREYFLGQKRQLVLKSPDGYIRAKGAADVGDIGTVVSLKRSGVIKTKRSYFSKFFSSQKKIYVPVLNQIILRFRERIFRHTDRVSDGLASWYRAFLLGDYLQLEKVQNNSFKAVGMVHVLVVSGLHVGLFAIVVVKFLLSPFWLLYICGWLKADLWVLAKILSSVLAVSSSWVYAASVGFSPAAQRAFIVFAVISLLPIIFGKMPLGDRLLVALTVQFLWFPNGIFSDSLLISWSAYLALLIPLSFLRKDSMILKIKKIVLSQFYLSVIIFAFVGSFSILGFFANMLLIPAFPLVFFSAFVVCFFDLPLAVEELIHGFQLGFLQIISFLSNYSSKVTGGAQDALEPGLRILCVVFFVASVLIFFAKVPIKKA